MNNLTAGTEIIFQMKSDVGGSAYSDGNGRTFMSYKMLGLTTNVITPLKWTYKYTVNATSANPFLFGPGSIYAIGNTNAAADGLIRIYNKSGVSMIVNANGLFNSTSAFYIGNNSNSNITLANNAFIDVCSNAIYLLGQYIEGYFNDITNNRHFKYSWFYYANYRAIVNIEQIIY